MARMKRCPHCDIYPSIAHDRMLWSTAKVYCPKCGRHTDWYDGFWASTASDRAQEAWDMGEIHEVDKKENKQMPTKAEGMGTIYIDGNALLKMIDAIVCEELPVDEQWAKGLKYSKRIIKQMMGIDQEEGV